MVAPPNTGGGPTSFAAVNRPATELNTSSPAPPKAKATPSNPSAHSINSAMPLSARRADPLDLSTVERRGYPGAATENPRKSRLHDIPEAPTFRPTEDEFKDPMEYMRKIAPEGQKYGIVKIIPPESWNPDFALDTTVCTPRQHSAGIHWSDTIAALPFPSSPSGTQLCRRRYDTSRPCWNFV